MTVTPKHRPATLLALALALALTAAVTTGCGDEPAEQPGILSVTWKISPLGCDGAGVTNIDVELLGAKGPVGERLLVGCAAGRASVEGLAPGAYTLNLIGLDASSKAIFESGDTAVGIADGGVTTVGPLRLTAKRANLNVYWFFDNGRLCASNGIKTMAMGVYDADGFAISEDEAPCEEGVGAIEGLQSGEFIIEVVGMAADGTSQFRGLQQVEIKRGDDASVEVRLAECQGDC